MWTLLKTFLACRTFLRLFACVSTKLNEEQLACCTMNIWLVFHLNEFVYGSTSSSIEQTLCRIPCIRMASHQCEFSHDIVSFPKLRTSSDILGIRATSHRCELVHVLANSAWVQMIDGTRRIWMVSLWCASPNEFACWTSARTRERLTAKLVNVRLLTTMTATVQD